MKSQHVSAADMNTGAHVTLQIAASRDWRWTFLRTPALHSLLNSIHGNQWNLNLTLSYVHCIGDFELLLCWFLPGHWPSPPKWLEETVAHISSSGGTIAPGQTQQRCCWLLWKCCCVFSWLQGANCSAMCKRGHIHVPQNADAVWGKPESSLGWPCQKEQIKYMTDRHRHCP